MKPFEDRIDAARQLAGELRRFAASHPLVLAIPRGAFFGLLALAIAANSGLCVARVVSSVSGSRTR